MSKEQIYNIIFIILSVFAVYFTHVIYGKFILLCLLLIFIGYLLEKNHISYQQKALFLISSIVILSLSLIDKCFLIGFVILFKWFEEDTNKQYEYLFINTLLLTCIVENIYFTCIDINYIYWFWGLPIVLLSFILGKIDFKKTNILFFILLMIIVIAQFIFNLQNYNQNIYTYSNKNNISANYSLLRKYFNNVYNFEGKKELKIENNSTVILPICETKSITKENLITPNKNYILLGEHDNLNNFIEKYPYINNDSYFRQPPWNLFAPIINSSFKYFLNDDIFYASNIGATVKTGHPIIWEYTNWGKPILLATFKKINNSNVYIWGDSDFLGDKLMPYNLNFIEKVLNRNIGLYSLFLILFIATNALLYNKNKYLPFIMFVAMTIGYFFPIRHNYNSEIKLYSQVNYLTAHSQEYPSSFLNNIALKGITISRSRQDGAQIQIIKKETNWKDLQHSKLIYSLSNSQINLQNGQQLYCSNIKLGAEVVYNKDKRHTIIDARPFILNGRLTNSSVYDYKSTKIVCTNSPQLNVDYTRSVVLNEK